MLAYLERIRGYFGSFVDKSLSSFKKFNHSRHRDSSAKNMQRLLVEARHRSLDASDQLSPIANLTKSFNLYGFGPDGFQFGSSLR